MSGFIAVRKRDVVEVLSDGAGVMPDGRVTTIGSKIVIIPGMACALVERGTFFARGDQIILSPARCVANVAAAGCRTFDALVDRFDEIMAVIEPAHRATFPEQPEFDIAVAGWTQRDDQPRLFFWTNDMFNPNVEPYRLIERPFVFAGPEPTPERLSAAGWSYPASEDECGSNDLLAMLRCVGRLTPTGAAWLSAASPNWRQSRATASAGT